MIDKSQKEWIDNASYEQLLSRWRFAPVGDPMFQGETGKYYEEIMSIKRKKIGDAAHTRASKNIGWRR